MSYFQQKQARPVQSINYNDDSPNKPHLITTSNVTEAGTKNSATNGGNTQSWQSRALLLPQNQITGNLGLLPQNKLFYSQSYGKQDQGLTVYYNQLSPGQIHRKSIEQLQYENGVLLQQLQERDEIIALYKSGWKSQAFPINDQVIKNLNLQLAQKNVLIQQFHRSLAQFQQTVKRQNIQLSPTCSQQINRLQILIIRHQHYPILITQKLIQTSKQAQTIYIKDMTLIQQYILKLQHSYKQVTTLRQKLIWFQKQHQSMQLIMINLKNQLEEQKHKYNHHLQQNNHLKIQITQYLNQINTLKLKISQFQAQTNGSNSQLAMFKQQVNTYKQQISNYIIEINNYKSQITSLQSQITNNKKQIGQIILLQNQITTLKKQINVYISDSANYKSQINSKQNQIDGLNHKLTSLQNQLNGYKLQINTYISEITSYKQEITKHQTEIDNWKRQFQNIQSQNKSLNQQINIYTTQINNTKIEIQTLTTQIRQLKRQAMRKSQIQSYKLQITKYTEQLNTAQQKINLYAIDISKLKQQVTSLEQQNAKLRRQLNKPIDCGHSNQISKLKQQISSLTLKIQSQSKTLIQMQKLSRQISKLKNDILNYTQKNNSLNLQLDKYKQQIYTYQQQITILTQQKDKLFDIQWQLDSIKRQNQRLKNDNTKYKKQLSQFQQQKLKLSQQSIKLKNKITRLQNQSQNTAYEWKSKYDQSQSIIRKLRLDIQQHSLNIQSTKQWKSKYQTIQTKYKHLQQQLQYYKLQYKNIQDRSILQQKSIKQQLQSQFNYKLTLLQDKAKRTIKEELENQIKIDITNKLKIQYQIKINQNKQLLQHKIHELQSIIQQLKLQLQKLKNQATQSRSYLQQAQLVILQLQNQLKKRPQPQQTININVTIQQLTSQIKQLLQQISHQTKLRSQLQYKYKQQSQSFTSTKQQLQLTINRLNEQIQALKRQLLSKTDGSKEWQKQKKQLLQKYQKQQKQRWDQLHTAQQYNTAYTKQSQQIIAYLQQRLKQFQSNVQGSIKTMMDTYLYYIDPNYQQIKKRIISISHQNQQSVLTQSQYWQSYRQNRKQQIQQIQTTINQSLTYMSQIQQAILIKKQQLHRLDLTKLQPILQEIAKINKNKQQLKTTLRKELSTKFYGTLQSVSTTIRQ